MLLCRVEACLPHCQRFEVNDAQAYLLERLGDVAAAIKLYVKDIQRCNAALIHAVLQGDLQLPNITGRYCTQTCFRWRWWPFGYNYHEIKFACLRLL